MSTIITCTPKTIINDHMAHLINKMAEKFYSNPENKRKYAEWHLKEYGCLPDSAEGGIKNA